MKIVPFIKNKTNIIIGFIIPLMFTFSCATILNSNRQAVRLDSAPQGANVTINGKRIPMTTPCLVELKRKVKPSPHNKRNEYRFLFTKEGFANYEYTDYRRINPTVYFNALTWMLVVITTPVDFITGASYKYNDEIFANLQQLQQSNNQTITKIEEHPKAEDRDPPTIQVYSPDLERGFKHTQGTTMVVSGKADDISGIDEVKINGIEATVDGDGRFEVIIPLKTGTNKIVIMAKDNYKNVALESFYIERNELSETENNSIKNADFGNYYALIIGIIDYNDKAFADLDYPLKDADKIYKTLTQYYNFDSANIILLKNPGREQITEKLELYFNKLTNKDNLLIFYAGHGYWDAKFKQGYWIPTDAEFNNRGTWISNSTIRDYIRAIPSKHSLLITDACFSGAIMKSRDAFPDASKAINQMYDLSSRKAMTSGALSQVPDKSVFIQYLIKRLEENQEKYLSSEQLFASFKMAVINNSPGDQVPQFGEIKETGDEGGDFIFIKK